MLNALHQKYHDLGTLRIPALCEVLKALAVNLNRLRLLTSVVAKHSNIYITQSH